VLINGMPGMGESAKAVVRARRPLAWLGFVTASAVAVAAWAGFWWLAVPRFDVCAAVLPAPAGCRSADRIGTAVLWSTIVAVLYVATVALTVVRPRGRWWPSGLAIAALGIGALWACAP
jgi:hypothetical protein